VARPCTILHNNPDPSCPHCRAAFRSAKVRRAWDCHTEFAGVDPSFLQMSKPVPVNRPAHFSIELPVIDCPFRSDKPVSYCGSCGNSKNSGRYDCERFDEIVALYPRKGVRDCQKCKDNPNGAIVQLEIKT
jgi:hypothetical protein